MLRCLSSSMIFASSSWPMYGSRSRTRRISTRDAGRKPRRPMSRMRPPLTTSITVPVTGSSLACSSSMAPQARSYCARFLDRIKRPSLSSLVRTSASTSSPTSTTSSGLTSCLMDSSREGITPSVLYPMSSSTSSWSTLTTVPSTMSPSLKYLMVASTAARKSSAVPISLIATCGVLEDGILRNAPNKCRKSKLDNCASLEKSLLSCPKQQKKSIRSRLVIA